MQALQSQGVTATPSTKLSQRDKTTLQAAAGIVNVANFTLARVYEAHAGEEGNSDDKFHRELVSIFSGDEETRVHVTMHLTKDLRSVNLGENGSILVATMYKGITPFAVLFKEYAQIHKEDARQNMFGPRRITP